MPTGLWCLCIDFKRRLALEACSSFFFNSLHSGSSSAFSKDPNGMVTLAGRFIQSGSFPRSPAMFLLFAPTTPS